MKSDFSRLTSLVCLVALSLFAPRVNAQYCSPTYTDGCYFGGALYDFTLTGELGTSFNDLAVPCGGIPGGYQDRTAETPVILFIGNTYTINADETTFAPGDNCQIWIDFDNSGTFDASETIAGGAISTTLSPYLTVAIPTPIVTPGNYHMRVGISNINAYPNLTPCPALEPLGEIVDYIVTIQTSGSVSTCSSPTVTLGTTGCTTQVINWTLGSISSISSTSDWVVDNSSSSPSVAGTATTALTATATGLTPSTLYYAHVRHDCGGGSYSPWVTVSFTTSAGPAAITGPTTVCPGGTINMSDVTAGGTWSSGNPTIASVSGSTVTGGSSAGSANISYTLGSCSVSLLVTVGAMPSITGTTSICTGGTSQLSDATSGGTWTSSNPAIASISSTGFVTAGTTAGNTTITYAAGGCSITTVVTVGSLPSITGNLTVCPGSTTQLSDATTGGFWGSSNTSVATIVQSSGLAYGTTAGTTTIVYGLSASCTATVTLTVAALPSITSDGNTVCAGATIQMSDATSGGAWTSSNNSFATVSGSGLVTGVGAGSVTITYTLGACYVTKAITVDNAVLPITGTPTTFCVTSSTTLSDATAGGTWSSSNPAVASVTGTVVVHGVSAGTATISYSLGGCSVTQVVNVDANNAGIITGKDSICAGAGHSITLSDNVPGGVWSSSNTSKITINPSTGVATGVVNGNVAVTISYRVTNTCGTYTATYTVHVRAANICNTGVDPVAETQITELKVFPNPNGGIFTMNLSSDIDEEVHVMVTNIVGEKVKEFTTATNAMFDIKLNSAPGIYLLSAFTAHGRYVAKVVVEK